MVSISTVALIVPCGMPSSSLRQHEHIVPEPRLQVAFHLGQIEIGAGAAVEQRLGVVEEVQAEVEEAGRDGLAIDEHMLFRQVPAARAHQQGGDLLVEAIVFAFRAVEVDGAADGVAQVDLSLDSGFPGGRVGVLEVGHEDVRAGVQRVDHHFAVDRPGDLDAAILQIGGNGRDGPVALADAGGFGQEVGRSPGVEPALWRSARCVQQGFAPRHRKVRDRQRNKPQGVGGEYFSRKLAVMGAGNLDPFQGALEVGG